MVVLMSVGMGVAGFLTDVVVVVGSRDGNFSPPRITRPSPFRPARVFPAPQRR